jgi:hypothetical protein
MGDIQALTTIIDHINSNFCMSPSKLRKDANNRAKGRGGFRFGWKNCSVERW